MLALLPELGHMAALVAARHNPELKIVYLQLRDAGKPFKVTLVSVARTLLIRLNSIIEKFYRHPVAA